MIKNFEEQTKPLSEKEIRDLDTVCKILQGHTKENPIKSFDIADIASRVHGRDIKGSSRVRKIINRIVITERIPNICTSSNGYWIEFNLNTLEGHSLSLMQRAQSQMARANVVDNYIDGIRSGKIDDTQRKLNFG